MLLFIAASYPVYLSSVPAMINACRRVCCVPEGHLYDDHVGARLLRRVWRHHFRFRVVSGHAHRCGAVVAGGGGRPVCRRGDACRRTVGSTACSLQGRRKLVTGHRQQLSLRARVPALRPTSRRLHRYV